MDELGLGGYPCLSINLNLTCGFIHQKQSGKIDRINVISRQKKDDISSGLNWTSYSWNGKSKKKVLCLFKNANPTMIDGMKNALIDKNSILIQFPESKEGG